LLSGTGEGWLHATTSSVALCSGDVKALPTRGGAAPPSSRIPLSEYNNAPFVTTTSYTIFLTGVALEVCILWRLSRRQQWRQYFYFLFYVLYDFIVLDLILFGVWRFAPSLYRGFYWGSETISAALRFLVIWEVFRHTFPKGSALQQIASKGIGLVSLGLGLFSVSVFWSLDAYSRLHSPYAALERGFGFSQAVLILGILLMARYYGVQFGRNMWGVALGFGTYVSICVVNFAVIDLQHSFLPYWQALVPLSFNAMLAVWTWAVWTYAPNPPIVTANTAEQAAQLGWWTDHWNRMLSTVRRVVHS